MADHIIEVEDGVLKYKYLPFNVQGPKQREPHRLMCLNCAEEFNGHMHVVFKGRVAYRMYLHKECKPPAPYTEEPDFNKIVIKDSEGNHLIEGED